MMHETATKMVVLHHEKGAVAGVVNKSNIERVAEQSIIAVEKMEANGK